MSELSKNPQEQYSLLKLILPLAVVASTLVGCGEEGPSEYQPQQSHNQPKRELVKFKKCKNLLDTVSPNIKNLLEDKGYDFNKIEDVKTSLNSSLIGNIWDAHINKETGKVDTNEVMTHFIEVLSKNMPELEPGQIRKIAENMYRYVEEERSVMCTGDEITKYENTKILFEPGN